MLRGFERTSQVPMTWGPSCKRERERDGYAGPQRVASNKRSSLLTVNASKSLRKLKFWEPSLHLSNSLIKQPVDIDVYYDAKTKNRNTNQRTTGLVDMDYVTAKHYSKVTILEKNNMTQWECPGIKISSPWIRYWTWDRLTFQKMKLLLRGSL